MSVTTTATTTTTLTQEIIINWQLEDYAYFRKCGEITTSPDEQCFGLNCAFCPSICLQFDVFMQHIREEHSARVKAIYCGGDETQETQNTTQATQTEEDDDDNDVNTRLTNPKESNIINWWSGEVLQETDSIDSAPLTSLITRLENVDMPETEVVVVEEEDKQAIVTPLPPPPPPAPQTQEEFGLVFIVANAIEEIAQSEHKAKQKDTTYAIPDPLINAHCTWQDTTNSNSIDKQNNDEIQSEKSTRSIKSRRRITSSTKTITNSKDKYLKTSRMREIKKNHEVIKYLIDAYKCNEKLWNPQHTQYKYNANAKLFDELSEPLQRDMNCKLNGTEIFGLVRMLRSRYRQELNKERKGSGVKTKLWYFEKLDFLRNIIENKRAIRAEKLRLENAENEQLISTTTVSTICDSTKSIQNRDILSYLLDAFKRKEILWNPQHPEYLSSTKNDHYNDISIQLLDDMNVKLTGDECFTEIQKLRTRYRKELCQLLKRKGLHVSQLWCFDQMEFLRKIFEDQIRKRLNKRNGVNEIKPRTKYLKAQAINFENNTDQYKFIEIYRNYAALWDVDHPDYRSATYRNNTLKQMLLEINAKLLNNYTLDQLQKTLYEMHKEFSAQKQKILSLRETDARSTDLLSDVYEKLLEFLGTNVGPFCCDVCGMIIKTSDQYKIHQSGHNGTQPFICTLCGKGFQLSGNLSIHIRRHKRDFPYACAKCDKRFATSSEVAIHMRTHTGERPYVCDMCGKSFKTYSFFDVHQRTHLQQSPFHCPICEKSFYEKNRFTDHMNGHLNIRKHVCNICLKSFTTYANLRKHNELHLPVHKYKCDLCDRRFAQFASLRWHKRKMHAHLQYEQHQQMEQ